MGETKSAAENKLPGRNFPGTNFTGTECLTQSGPIYFVVRAVNQEINYWAFL